MKILCFNQLLCVIVIQKLRLLCLQGDAAQIVMVCPSEGDISDAAALSSLYHILLHYCKLTYEPCLSYDCSHTQEYSPCLLEDKNLNNRTTLVDQSQEVQKWHYCPCDAAW